MVAPTVWGGFGLFGSVGGRAVLGSNDEDTARIAEYHELGFDHVILSGQPHLEEAYWFGEGVIPRLREAGLLADRGATVPAAPAASAAPSRPVLVPASAS